MSLNTIYQLIAEDLTEVENQLKSVSDIDFPFLAELVDYSLKDGGKRIRPVLTILCGKLYEYAPETHRLMATSVELMHTATLIHDDAIDQAIVRRGRPTVNEVWGQDIAILLGDYMFARAGEFAADTQNLRVIKLFAQTLGIISAGEVNQAFNAFNPEQTHEHYLQRIYSKTGSLFTLATESGAILSGAPEEAIQALREYGSNLGIAFQIVDDILDYTSTEEEMGKPIGSDLAQGTLTLPAMLLLERYPEDNPVKRVFRNENKEENIKLALEMARDPSIIQECYRVASDYCTRAARNLDLLPEGTSRQALTDLTSYIIARQK